MAALLISVSMFAQNSIKAVLVDSSTGDPLGFATVSLHKKDQPKALKYVLSNENGVVNMESVRNGNYIFKAELMGYKEFTKEIKIASATIDLGTIKMDLDAEQLDAAKVSAAGNPIVIKKDTIEFNANHFKTSDNDVLEDLIKKLPGAEVAEDGSITVNGQTIKQIRIEGKTFFLDDPQLASKNIPAKAIEKLKVIEKKSDQAQFTGISDGEEETIIDLSMKPGMMKGLFGTVTAGGGLDIPSSNNSNDQFRFQAGGFAGSFNKKSQISVIVNANNTNNRAYNDVAGNMMGNMMGGGGMGRGQGGWGNGNGITTSYMAGVNGAFDLFDDKMNLTANYLYNNTNKDVWEKSFKRAYYQENDILTNSDGTSNTHTVGNRVGMRLEHKFSENTSIIFEPQVNFGDGGFAQSSTEFTQNDDHKGNVSKLKDATINNSGSNKNVNTSGFFLLRQRLGKEGRTLTAMSRYAFSNNDLLGNNINNTLTYAEGGNISEKLNQRYEANQKSSSVFARATYTEPIAENFFLEANYSYNWRRSSSDKETFDMNNGGVKDFTYSNNILNLSTNHEMGANVMYQKDKISAQLGFAAIPTHTYNSTTKYDPVTQQFAPKEYSDDRWNFSPRAMFWGEFSESSNMRLFYWGNSSQPSTTQLMPVPDNTNPLSLSFGNPGLTPYFSHSIRGDYRYNNKKSFFSLNVRFNAGLVQNPIVSALWNNNGVQYTMPFNGHDSANAGMNISINSPIARSNFSIMNFTRVNWSTNSSYVGSKELDMSKYSDPTKDYYKFMEEFVADHRDMDNTKDFITNVTNTLSVVERLRLTYRIDALELTASARTRMNKSWYTIADNTMTFNNQAGGSINWTWDATGIGLKSDINYNWYNGYTVDQPSQLVFNAEISKLLFKKKATLSLKGYDILGQARNLTVTDNSNYHMEAVNNTLGRYVILALTYRFGNFNNAMGKMGGGPRGPMGPPGRR